MFYQPEYSVYVLRQASRSWRIGQRQPVEISYLVYAGTLQAEALSLVAAKLRSSLMVEGELPEDGLAAPGGRSDGHSLEALFAQNRDQEEAADELLVTDPYGVDAAAPTTTVPAERAEPIPTPSSVSDGAPGGISFLELAKLVRRTRRARRVAPGQLSLFDR